MGGILEILQKDEVVAVENLIQTFDSLLSVINTLIDAVKYVASIFINFGKRVGDFAEQLEKTEEVATALGITRQALEKLEYVALQLGVNLDDLNGALKELDQKKALVYQNRGGPEAALFKQAGVNPFGPVDKMFLQLRQLAKEEPGSERGSAAAKLLEPKESKSSIDRLLKAEPWKVDQLQKDAGTSGYVVKTNGTDTIKSIGIAFEGLTRSALGPLLDSLHPLLDLLNQWLIANGQLLGSGIGELLKAVGEGFFWFSKILFGLSPLVKFFLENLDEWVPLLQMISTVIGVLLGVLAFVVFGLYTIGGLLLSALLNYINPFLKAISWLATAPIKLIDIIARNISSGDAANDSNTSPKPALALNSVDPQAINALLFSKPAASVGANAVLLQNSQPVTTQTQVDARATYNANINIGAGANPDEFRLALGDTLRNHSDEQQRKYQEHLVSGAAVG